MEISKAFQADFTVQSAKHVGYHIQTEDDLEKRGVLAQASHDVRVGSVKLVDEAEIGHSKP